MQFEQLVAGHVTGGGHVGQVVGELQFFIPKLECSCPFAIKNLIVSLVKLEQKNLHICLVFFTLKNLPFLKTLSKHFLDVSLYSHSKHCVSASHASEQFWAES